MLPFRLWYSLGVRALTVSSCPCDFVLVQFFGELCVAEDLPLGAGNCAVVAGGPAVGHGRFMLMLNCTTTLNPLCASCILDF